MSLLLYRKIEKDTHLGVWHLDESFSELKEYVNLGENDLLTLLEIKSNKRQMEWLGCRAILSEILQNKNIDINYNIQGKPLLKNSFISFSHTNNYSAAIVSSQNFVAIDIEGINNRIINVAQRFLSHEEKKWTKSQDLLVLTIIWSAKESIFKHYSLGGLEFNNNINIYPFEPQQKGRIEGVLNLAAYTKTYIIHYEILNNSHVLTYIKD